MTSPVEPVVPGPGQESVWDYPLPPRVEPTSRHIRVVFNGVALADSRRAQRVLETSQAPVYYVPPEDIQMQYPGHRSQLPLQSIDYGTRCEKRGGLGLARN